jgi:hypothetical protein
MKNIASIQLHQKAELMLTENWEKNNIYNHMCFFHSLSFSTISSEHADSAL